MNPEVVLGVAGSLITLTVLVEMMRRQRLREKYAVLWVLVALGTLTVTVYPPALYRAADALGVSVPANLLFFLGSMVLMLVSIHHSQELSRLEDRTQTLAEEVALLRMDADGSRRFVTGPADPDPNPHQDT